MKPRLMFHRRTGAYFRPKRPNHGTGWAAAIGILLGILGALVLAVKIALLAK